MSQRYPISIRLTGVMEKDKKKLYITSVLWSDEEEIVVYRTVEDFKKMHKQIKKAFPGAKKSERIVPKFKAGKKSKAVQKNGTSKSLNYLKPLQRYCNELLSCDPQVNQSVHLIQFLHPKNEELQPEYSKNGVIIMPPETQAQEEQFHSQGGNVTQPFSTETYRCVAPYETKDTKNKAFKVALNEKVDVLIKDKAGWWLVENDDKCMAWFPAPYLERTDDEPEEDNIDGLPERGLFYTVTKSYKSTKDDEISVSIGASVEVLQKSENGWWLIRYKGQAGYIPSMYLKPPNYGHVRRGHREQSSPILLSPSNLAVQSQLSRSQDNLQKLNTDRPALPTHFRPLTRQLSRSAEVLNPPTPAAKPPPISLPKPRPVPPPNTRRAPSPDPRRAPSPDPRRAPSPDPRHAPFPDPRRAPFPDPRRAPSPDPRHDPSPDPRRAPSPDPRHAPSHDPRRAPSPDPRHAPSHDPRRAPSPDPRHAPSPDPRRAPSPDPRRATPPKPGRVSPPNPGQASPANASYVPTPIIMVRNAVDDHVSLSRTWDSETEFTSDSDFSSDEYSSSSASTTISLSMSTDDYRLRHSRTPPPPSSNTLSPQSATGGKMTPAVSDPNIFKSDSAPKVPPRPQTQEILSRCTTITRKNANRSASPSPTQIQTR